MSHEAPSSSQDAVQARKQEVAGHTESHGHSVAAWTGVAIVLVGALIASVAMLFPIVWLVVVGIVLMPIGGLVGMLLAKMGYGQAAHASSDPSGQGHS